MYNIYVEKKYTVYNNMSQFRIITMMMVIIIIIIEIISIVLSSLKI